MFDFGNFRFPSVNKAFLRGIFWLLIFLFLATIFVSARGIYDRFLQKPELRISIFSIGKDFYEKDGAWIQRGIIVENQGNADATNVLITSFMPNGIVSRIDINSDERYLIEYSGYDSRNAWIDVPRLAQGGAVRILLWGKYLVPIDSIIEQPQPQIHVAYDGGVAESRDTPTALEEIKNLGDLVTSGFVAMYIRFDNQIGFTMISNAIYNNLARFGIYDISYGKIPNDFRAALVSSIIISGCCWLLLSRGWAGLLIASLIGLLLWLYTDFTVNIVWLAFAVLLTTVSALLTDNEKEAAILSAVLAIGLTILYTFTYPEQWACIGFNNFSWIEMFNCVPVHIPGSITIGFFIVNLYLFATDL